jgi:hypothetical protein
VEKSIADGEREREREREREGERLLAGESEAFLRRTNRGYRG